MSGDIIAKIYNSFDPSRPLPAGDPQYVDYRAVNWDEELPVETEDEVYRALLRALRRKQGFGLFFVQCSTSQGYKIIANLRRDLSGQQIQALYLVGEVTALYDRVAELWQQEPFDLLIIEGLQASLYAYEDTKRFRAYPKSQLESD